MKTGKKVSLEKAQANAATLRAFLDAGRESLNKCPPDRLRYGKTETALRRELRRVEGDADRLGLGDVRWNLDTLAKMRRVGHEFDEAEIERLRKSVVRCRSPFSMTHLTLLLAVEDQAGRAALAEKAIDGCWSNKALKRAIQAAYFGRRLRAGRPPELPQDRAELVVELRRMAGKWRKWCEAALPRLPKDLKGPASRALEAARRVEEAVLAKLKPPRPKKTPRKQPRAGRGKARPIVEVW